MPPKKTTPMKKPAPKKTVAKKAAKPAAKKAVKTSKPAPKASVKKPIAKPVVKAATLWQPTAAVMAAPGRPSVPYTPALNAAALSANTAVDVLKLTWAYLWRWWLFAISWAVIAIISSGLLAESFPLFATPTAQGLMLLFYILASFACSIYVMWWLTHTPRVMGNLRLVQITRTNQTVVMAANLWFSFLWRSLIWALVAVAVETALTMSANIIAASFPLLGWSIGMVVTTAGFAFNLFFMSFLVWRQLLKKRTFSWGNLELIRVKA